MNDFRILNENTFNLKGGKLYLMLLRQDGNFGVEVVNREKTFGRKFAKDREQATYLFNELTNKLNKYKLLTDAESAIKRCFSTRSIDKLLFTIIADDNILTQADISEMGKRIHFRLIIKAATKKRPISIFIYESSKHKKPFGILIGKSKKFRFELL